MCEILLFITGQFVCYSVVRNSPIEIETGIVSVTMAGFVNQEAGLRDYMTFEVIFFRISPLGVVCLVFRTNYVTAIGILISQWKLFDIVQSTDRVGILERRLLPQQIKCRLHHALKVM